MESATRRRRGRPAGLQGADLLATAREAMFELGLAGTTMAEIARRAGISKASLYREHESKDALFVAVVLDWTTRGRYAMRPVLDALLDADDLECGLVALARVIQGGVLDPDVVRMRRMIAAEADRFPEMADRYVAESWDRNILALGETLAEVAERRQLRITDPAHAARQFTWLAVGDALNRQTLGATSATEPQLQAAAEGAASMVLARYTGASPPHHRATAGR